MLDQISHAPHGVPSSVRAILDTAEAPAGMRKGAKRFWTNKELRIIRETYPLGGLEACMAALPDRSASGIYQAAGREGVRKLNAAGKPLERRTYSSTPQIDAAIRAVFMGEPKLGAIKRLALTLGRPRTWVSNRARFLGLVVPRFKQLPWSEAELAIVRQYGKYHPDTVRRHLKEAGFSRSSVAVSLMVKRQHIEREIDDNLYTARGLGLALGVDSQAVTTWIARGWLKAKRKKVEAGCDPLKGDWQIHRNAIRDFVVENVALVDFRKVDKFWLVDLLNEQSWEK